jgi:hypothetical protein
VIRREKKKKDIRTRMLMTAGWSVANYSLGKAKGKIHTSWFMIFEKGAACVGGGHIDEVVMLRTPA